MSLRIILAASAVLAFAAPAMAQDAPAAPPAAATDANAEAEAAFEAKGEAFEASMEAMGAEMHAAVTDAAGDQAKAATSLDAIVAKYQPAADAFAVELEAFIVSQMGNVPEEQRAQMTAMGPMISAQIKGAPGQARDQALASMAAEAPAAPAE